MIGAGTTFALTTDGGTNYVVTANIKELTFPEETRDTSEDSYLDSTDIYKNYVVGMADSGELDLVLKWDVADAQQVELNTRFEAQQQSEESYQIKFPDNTTWTFNAVITGRGREVPKNETITQSFKFKLSGAPVEVAGA